ncbi:hypothetical protein HPULCUR_008171 [Helicostylum pulchrum]|uniref:Uncharacterized protein n=1 Tax=Helicostylum pulchrum TaxID=562976 RepID=A0ABP9Y6U9_9FUNG
MLEPEASASLVYTILFFLFSIALIGQSLSHWHLTPFALYAICVASGNLYVLLVPEFTSDQRSWRYQEPILNQLPVYSILIFAGIIDWQFVYIRFIATTVYYGSKYRKFDFSHFYYSDYFSNDFEYDGGDLYRKQVSFKVGVEDHGSE